MDSELLPIDKCRWRKSLDCLTVYCGPDRRTDTMRSHSREVVYSASFRVRIVYEIQ